VAIRRWQAGRMRRGDGGVTNVRDTDSIEDRIDRIEDKIEHLSDLVARVSEDLESGFADVRRLSDQEFKQLKQAITFWGGRARATR
jgi:hypothetical protein